MKLAMIRKWQQLLGNKTTDSKFCEGLLKIGRVDLIEDIASSMPKAGNEPGNSSRSDTQFQNSKPYGS